jgi:uncharacterized membrane protein
MNRSTNKIAIIASLAALSVATNYALVGLPNVKAMDFLVFIGGVCFGPFAGVLIGILGWAIYGVLNPYGFVLQVWLATMLFETIYGLVGGVVGMNLVSINFYSKPVRMSFFYGVLGCILTILYDSALNVVYALVFGVPILAALVLGAPFQVLHAVSNTLIFASCSIPIIRIIKRIGGG